MIKVSLATLLLIYLLTSIGLIFIVWVFYDWRKRRHESALLRHRLRCTMCAYDFEDRSTALLPRCPRCGSLNERFPFRPL